MLPSQKLKLRLNQLSLDLLADGLAQETRDAKEAEQKEVLKSIVEAETAENAKAETSVDHESAEHREAIGITRKADLGVLVGSILSKRNTSGAEAEAQAAWGIEGDRIPLAMLAEIRATDAPDSGGGSQPISGYAFPTSIAQFCNINRPRVAPGVHVYPSISGAATAGRPAEAGTQADTDATLRGELLTPKRIQATTKISVEDRARFAGLGAAVAAHMAGAVAAGLDAQALSDTGGFFDAVAASQPLTPAGDPGSATTYTQWAAILGSGVDGRYAPDLAAVGLLVHPDAFNDAEELYRGNNTSESFAECIARVSRLMVSASMPATASSISGLLVVKGTRQASVQPLWDGLSIEDPYTEYETGEIRFNVVGLAAFSCQQPSAYEWGKVHVG